VMGALVAALHAEGGTLSELVRPADDPASGGPGPPQLAASGPRAAGREAEYELLLEMIFEGSLLHYGAGRVVQTTDPDLALLLGDQLYALGLTRLAELGDLEAVNALAEVISRLAQAHAEGNGESAEAIWHEGALAVGWGRHAPEARDARLDLDDSLSRPHNSGPGCR
jgi:hypothetical protein